MIVELLTEHHLKFLSLKGGCRGSSETTLVKCQIVGNLMHWLIWKRVRGRSVLVSIGRNMRQYNYLYEYVYPQISLKHYVFNPSITVANLCHSHKQDKESSQYIRTFWYVACASSMNNKTKHALHLVRCRLHVNAMRQMFRNRSKRPHIQTHASTRTTLVQCAVWFMVPINKQVTKADTCNNGSVETP